MTEETKSRNTGGNVNYYLVDVTQPKRKEHAPYTAECEDIILALGMSFEEGCAFKAIWRRCAAKKLGVIKKNYDGPEYDGEKVAHYGNLMVHADRLTALAQQIVGLTAASSGLQVTEVLCSDTCRREECSDTCAYKLAVREVRAFQQTVSQFSAVSPEMRR